MENRTKEERAMTLELHAGFQDFKKFTRCLDKYNYENNTKYSISNSRCFKVRATDNNKKKKDEELHKKNVFKYSEIDYICKYKISMKPENERCPSEISLRYDKITKLLVITKLNLNHECKTEDDANESSVAAEENSIDTEKSPSRTRETMESSPQHSPVRKKHKKSQVSFLVAPVIVPEERSDDSLCLADRVAKFKQSSSNTKHDIENESPVLADAEYSDQSSSFRNESVDLSMATGSESPKSSNQGCHSTVQRLDAIKMPVVIRKSSRRNRAIGLPPKSSIEKDCKEKDSEGDNGEEELEQEHYPTGFYELKINSKKKLLLRKLVGEEIATKALLGKYKIKKTDINFDRLPYTLRDEGVDIGMIKEYLQQFTFKKLNETVAGQRMQDKKSTERWICGLCKKTRNEAMTFSIICDQCLDRYHNTCVNLTDEPDSMSLWFCPDCHRMNMFQ